MVKLTLLSLSLLFSTAAAFAPQASTQSTTALSAETSGRREFFSKAAVAAAVIAGAAPAANAVVDYENIAYLGGSSIVDINNANVRAYLKMPGMYPAVAGKIVSHGPYSSPADVYKLCDLTTREAEVYKKYESKFVAKKPSPDYVIDRINNGL
jgi:photosystem II PsbU protein